MDVSEGGSMNLLLVAIGVGAVCLFLGYTIAGRLVKKGVEQQKQEAQGVLEQSRKEAETIRRQAELDRKEELYKLRVDFEKETRDKKRDLDEIEKKTRRP